MEQKKILLVDDDQFFRALLVANARDVFGDVELYDTDSIEGAVACLKLIDPVIIILDLVLPDSNGLDGIKTISSLSSSPILVISGNYMTEDIRSIENAGASGFLPKTGITPDQFKKTVINTLEGKKTIDFEPSYNSKVQITNTGLTIRENEVYRLISKGYSQPRVADELGISYETVKFHVKNIKKKIG